MSHLDHTRLIVALASGQLPSPIAIIRLTGKGCHQALAPLLNRDVRTFQSGRLSLCKLQDPQTGVALDQPMVVLFRQPNSYTGEDSAEIHCHGGTYLIQKVLVCLQDHGFHQAAPGEFTHRAFLNGKLDLTEAEGIQELIDAQSQQQWVAAKQLFDGKLGSLVDELRQKLIEAMAYLEAGIDFPEEDDVQDVHRQQAVSRVTKVSDGVKRLLTSYRDGRVAAEGLRVVLYGPPNTGKSTLLNEILGQDRAIVTHIPGTTRDYIEETCTIEGRLFRLIDTAGVRETDDEVEKIGVQRSLDMLHRADLVIDLKAANEFSTEIEYQPLPGQKVIRLSSKCDLTQHRHEDRLAISCVTKQGLSDLRLRLVEFVDEHVNALQDQVFLTKHRHKLALEEAQSCLQRFFYSTDSQVFDECLAFELQEASRALSLIIGTIDTEKILDQVFSEFCIGK